MANIDDVKVQKSLVVQDFMNVAVKSVNVIERADKKPLVFIDLVDTDTFQNTGEMMYLKKDMTMNDIMSLKQLERKKVKAVLTIGVYNNRPSVNLVEVSPL